MISLKLTDVCYVEGQLIFKLEADERDLSDGVNE